MKNEIIALIIYFQIQIIFGRIMSLKIPLHRFNEKSWKYIGKFGFNLGDSLIEIKAMFTNSISQNHEDDEFVNLKVNMYLDKDWSNANDRFKNCSERNSFSKHEATVSIPFNGEWSNLITMRIKEDIKPNIWYFSITDCDSQLKKYSDNFNRMFVEINLLNKEKDHFAAEEQGLILFYIIMTFCSLYFSTKHCYYLNKNYNETDTFDYPYFFIICGNEYVVFDIFSLIFSITSQLMLQIIFLLLSWGWTISFSEFEDYDIYIQLGFIFAAFEILVGTIEKLVTLKNFEYLHDYDGYSGWIINCVRICVFFYVLLSVNETISVSKMKAKQFFIKLKYFAIFFFLSFPLIALLTLKSDYYLRHRIISYSLCIIQWITITIFLKMFSEEKGEYQNISLKGKVPLPTQKGE